MRTVSAAALLCLALVAARAHAQQVALVQVATGFEGVTDVASAGDERLFVVEQRGRIRVVEGDGTVRPAPFLDLSLQVTCCGERGLLGLAFHPDYAANGHFFVNYIDRAGDTVIARFTVTANRNIANPGSRLVILRQDQPPFANHKGGDLAFGPDDGYLYIALGDGGSGCDPNDFAQGGGTFLGKVLRIDVDGGSPYAVPPDNPFVGAFGTRPEVWALGLRNPWRISFDRRPPHDLFIADVGQSQWEEVSVQPGGSAGGENYGWDCFEGRHAGTCATTAVCPPPEGHVVPIHEYSHALGCSITGGFVYRGSSFPALRGEYFFADFCSRLLWSLSEDRPGGRRLTSYGALVPGGPRTFGEDARGELYLATATTLYQVVDPSEPPPETGCPAEPATCDEPGKAVLLLSDAAPVGPSALDRLVFRSLRGPAEPPGAFGDPTDDTEVRLCVWAGEAQDLVTEASAAPGGQCAGLPCWVPVGSRGHRFTDPAGRQDGLTRVLLRPLPPDPGTKIVFKGVGASVPLPGLPLAAGSPVVAQVHRSGSGSCWGASFTADEVVRNDGAVFKAIHLD